MKATWMVVLALWTTGCSFLLGPSGSTAPDPAAAGPEASYAPPPVVSTHSMFSTGFRSYTTWNVSASQEPPSQPVLCKLPSGSVLAAWQSGAALAGVVMERDDALPSEPVKLLDLEGTIEGLACVGTAKGAVILWKDPSGDIVYHGLGASGAVTGKPGKVSDFKSMPSDFDAVAVGNDVYVTFVDGEVVALAHINAKGKVTVAKPIESVGGAKLAQVVEEKKGGLVYVFWAEDLPGFQNESLHYAGLDLKGKLKNGPYTISPAQGKIVEMDVTPDPMIDDDLHRFMASLEFVQAGGGRTSWKYYFHSGQLSESPSDNGATTSLMEYVDAEGDLSGECYALASGQVSGAGNGFRCWADNWPGDFHLEMHVTTGLTDVEQPAFSALLSGGTFYVAYLAVEQGKKDVFLAKAYDADLLNPPPPPPPAPAYSEPAYSSDYSSGYSSTPSEPSTPSWSPPPPTTGGSSKGVSSDCTFNGIKLGGKVEVVTAFPDVKVQVVSAFPDVKVKKVDAFADDCGEWQFVDAFPDFTIQYVDAFPDIKVEFVDAFPGL